jgi:hypothetical protein
MNTTITIIGTTIPIGAGLISFLNLLLPILSLISICIGITVGILALVDRQKRKKNK